MKLVYLLLSILLCASVLTITRADIIGQFTISSEDVYPDTYYYFNCTISETTAWTNIVNMTMSLDRDVILLWVNSTNTFSVYSDINGYVEELSTSTKTILNSTSLRLSWKLKLKNTYPTGWTDIDEYTILTDDAGNTTSVTYEKYFIFYTTHQNYQSGSTIEIYTFLVLFILPFVLIVVGLKIPFLCFFAIFVGFIFNTYLIANDTALIFNSYFNEVSDIWESHVIPIPAQPYLSLLAMMIYIMGSIIVFISKEHD